eukprot:COSAG02_NODE_108_length_36286_cov_19.437478_22_plen_51_part_00
MYGNAMDSLFTPHGFLCVPNSHLCVLAAKTLSPLCLLGSFSSLLLVHRSA